MSRWWLLLPLYFFINGSCPGPPDASPTQLSIIGKQPTPANGQPPPETNQPTNNDEPYTFPYGVASGDPLPSAVIIWSMLGPKAAQQDSTAHWQISRDPDFSTIVAQDTLTTYSQNHYRLKVDVTGLEPGTIYYYRFRQRGIWSAIGKTKTAPSPASFDPVKLAIVSCNALEWGYMNAYDKIAARNDLDAVVHLGDYIYEYASGKFGDTTLGRFHEPRHEVITLKDYHIRYAQYRRDPQLQAAHQNHPFICIWDDHEVANNSYYNGAENHNSCTEGDYLTRVSAAKQVYYDWMPIREKADGSIYRSFSFGAVADLHMLDERLAGRNAPATSFSPEDLLDTNRTMLGHQQLDWLCGQLRGRSGRWQLLGNQVLFAKLDLSDILPQYSVNLDAWDGYAYEQGRLMDSISTYGNPNTIFLTGDTHCSWYFDVENEAGERLAHELGTPSVSSANYDELIHSWNTLSIARYRLYRDNDHLHYTNIKDHGYLLLALNADQATASFHFSQTIRRQTNKERRAKTFTIAYEQPTLQGWATSPSPYRLPSQSKK